MRVNNIFEDKLFVSALLVTTISCIATIYMNSSNSVKTNCEPSGSNSVCSFFYLCKTVNNFVCEKKPYFATNTHIAIEGLFIFSLGFLTSYSFLKFTNIFNHYVQYIQRYEK